MAIAATGTGTCMPIPVENSETRSTQCTTSSIDTSSELKLNKYLAITQGYQYGIHVLQYCKILGYQCTSTRIRTRVLYIYMSLLQYCNSMLPGTRVRTTYTYCIGTEQQV